VNDELGGSRYGSWMHQSVRLAAKCEEPDKAFSSGVNTLDATGSAPKWVVAGKNVRIARKGWRD
jgi:hypothetical protein